MLHSLVLQKKSTKRISIKIKNLFIAYCIVLNIKTIFHIYKDKNVPRETFLSNIKSNNNAILHNKKFQIKYGKTNVNIIIIFYQIRVKRKMFHVEHFRN